MSRPPDTGGGSAFRVCLVEAEGEAEAQAQAARRLVQRYNRAHSNVEDARTLVLVARDSEGTLVGGAAGETWGEVFELAYLGVEEAWRQQGVGSALLVRAEAEAGARGCRRVVLDTYSFQAPAFYARHGYREYGRVGGFGGGAVKFLLTKELRRPSRHQI